MRLSMSSSGSAMPLPFSSTALSQTRPQNYSFLLQNPADPSQLYSESIAYQDTDPQTSPPKAKTVRYRLSQLCKQGQVHIAHKLFDSIPQPTTVIWNALIIGFVCNDMPHEAISLYSRMKWASGNQKCKCDAYTYSSVLKACAEAKQLLVGKAVHCHVLRAAINPSRIVYNSLLNMYATCLLSSVSNYRRDLVKRVFDKMPKRNVVAWNTLISWFSKTRRYMEAVALFVRLLKTGIRLTAVSFVNVFPAVSGLRDFEISNVLYGLLIKLGSEYANDPFVVSSAICMFAELGCLNSARMIFENCLETNTEIWNAMIGGYVQNNHPLEALELFLEAFDDMVIIDDVTLLSAVIAASQLQQLDLARQLHSYMIKNSSSSCILLNAIMAMYSRCNSISDSFTVFSNMQERDVVSWNTMSSALVQNGLDDEGVMLVHEMQKCGFIIDDVTVTALLSAASNLRNREIGRETHAYILRHDIEFDGMESYLIDMYAKSGMIKTAQRIFDRNCRDNRDQAIWNSMIAGNTQNGMVEEAFITFRRMLTQHIMPNAVTLASILPACSQSGSIALGKQLHNFAIRSLLADNVFVSSALVDMYSKSGAVNYAENVFLKSPERNSVTYTNMILGYGHHGMGDKAIKLFYSLREHGIEPDAVTFVAILSACSYSGLVDEGLEIFQSMETEFGTRPSTEHYACVIDMLGRVGRVAEAYDFVKEVSGECNMLGLWGSVLAACRIHRNFELGKDVAAKLLEIEGGNRIAGYHILLSNMHAEEGNWEYVDGVRKGMLKRGLKKEIGCSWIDTFGYANCFVSKDSNHPLCPEIYEMLDTLAANMTDAGCTPGSQSHESWVLELKE